MINFYKTLNLNFGAKKNRIQEAFINLSKKYHPEYDESQKLKKLFIETYTAYYVLSAENLRKNYDLLYRKEILKKKIKIDEERLQKLLEIWIVDSKKKANEYYSMPYKKFHRKAVKKSGTLLGFFLDFIDPFDWI